MEDVVPGLETEEMAPVRPKKLPIKPTLQEVLEHEKLHEPYRSWCRVCVAGRGQVIPHRSGEGSALPIVSLDYGYIVERENALPILAGKSEKWYFGIMLPSKGLSHPWNEKVVTAEIALCGHVKMLIRTDGEPAIVALKTRVAAELAAKHGQSVVPEDSARGSSSSNGQAEAAVREVKAKMRSGAMQIHDKMGITLTDTHPCIPWLAAWGAMSINLGRKGTDAYTACMSAMVGPSRASSGGLESA